MGLASIKRLLLIEDDPGFSRLLREMFKAQDTETTEITHVDCLSDGEKHLATHVVDIIILDPGLPDSQGIESVRRTHAAAPRVPLVVLTGRDDESLALMALQEGAQDYLVKGQIDTRGLLRFLRYAVQRNAMEDALFREQERARVTLDSIADAVVCTDISGKLTFLNRVAERMTGWTLEEADGRRFAEVIQIRIGTRREAMVNPVGSVLQRGRSARRRSASVLIGRDGSETPIEDSIAVIHDRDEKAAGAVIVFRDVSAARASQLKLAVIRAELKRSNRDLQEFATVASHDLQEPLRKIQAFGDRLVERFADVLDEEGRDYVTRMQNAAARMQSLIEDLMEYSQVGMQPEKPEIVDLERVVSDVLSDLEERLRITGGTVHMGHMPTIMANPHQMRQLFQNLIANALKFHAAGVAPEIHVDANEIEYRDVGGDRVASQSWEIRVRDNGIGFESHYADKIFAPFQRLNGRQAYEGHGMGLAICRRIAGLHGGTMIATSRPGAGATFVVTLPRVKSTENLVVAA